MERWWFNLMFFNKVKNKKKLERGCGLNKSMESLGPIENSSESEDLNLKDRVENSSESEYLNLKDTVKNIHSWKGCANSSSSNLDSFFGIKDIRNFISDDTFLVRDSNGDNYSIYFDIENLIFEIHNDRSFLNELESSFSNYRNSSYLSNRHKNEDLYDNHDTQCSWNNHINSYIDSYLQPQIYIEASIVSSSVVKVEMVVKPRVSVYEPTRGRVFNYKRKF